MDNYSTGPWYFQHSSSSCIYDDSYKHYCIEIFSQSSPVSIAYLQSFDENPENTKQKTIANATLIATAPELLVALIDMVESYEHEASPENPSLLKAKTVIAKAIGGN